MSTLFARRRVVVCLALALNLLSAPAVALAASDADHPPADPPILARALALSATLPVPRQDRATNGESRPAPLVPLYVSLAALQALDVTSTLRALDGPGVEANPLMRGVVRSPAAMIALKAGFTGLSIYSTEKVWRRSRTAAILMMVGMNGAYAAIVAHNYSVARSGAGR